MATPVSTGMRSPSMEIGETIWRFSRSPKWLVPSLPLVGDVLREDVARWNALHQQCANVADHRRHPVFFLERVGAADGDGLLAEAGIKAADNFVLAEEARHGVLDLAVKAHEVIKIEVLLARKLQLGGGFRGRHVRRFSGRKSGCLSYGQREEIANRETKKGLPPRLTIPKRDATNGAVSDP